MRISSLRFSCKASYMKSTCDFIKIINYFRPTMMQSVMNSACDLSCDEITLLLKYPLQFLSIIINQNSSSGMYVTLLTIFSILWLALSQTQPPLWADTFQAQFEEINKDRSGSISKIQAIVYYNYPTKEYRIDRDNGRSDRYCGTTYDKNTPCVHYVTQGKRFLYFPSLAKCCYCCDDEHGCGVLRPDWAADGSYVENVIDRTGRVVEKWFKMGGQPNYIYQTIDTKINTQIDMEPNNFWYFDLNTYSEQVDKSVFKLPDICPGAEECSGTSICARFRAGSLKE